MIEEARRQKLRLDWQRWRDYRFEPSRKLDVQAAYFFFEDWTEAQFKKFDPRFALVTRDTVVQWLREAGDITN